MEEVFGSNGLSLYQVKQPVKEYKVGIPLPLMEYWKRK